MATAKKPTAKKPPAKEPASFYSKANAALAEELKRRAKGNPSKGYGYGKNVGP